MFEWFTDADLSQIEEQARNEVLMELSEVNQLTEIKKVFFQIFHFRFIWYSIYFYVSMRLKSMCVSRSKQ